ncbi:MAG: single-stranded-DNA-specific exonuclease RecJ [Oscillospiraceae bacterium]|nr:single-stranded-DNA-specific exonuclease RecJ [Oscillospiraceae bacterium]
MVRKVWKFRNDKIKADAIKRAAQKNNIPLIIANILLNRDIPEAEFSSFMSKSKKDIKNPFDMLDMEKAADRIKTAIENHEKIVIYGDYDVDGITSTAMLYEFLENNGADVEYYIPDRKDEGYGINIMAVNKLIKRGINLLVTVDCGITAIGEVEFAKLQGMDVIITDHHTCKERIPTAAAAVVNPKRPDDEYGFDGLAGVGVAFKLVLALAIKLGLNTGKTFDEYVDLAAVGTIADVVPLRDENRIIVDKGLKLLQNPKRPGLRELLAVAGVADKKMNASTIAFSIAPRLNAAGRLGTAVTAVELLLTKDNDNAIRIARELDRENRERQDTEQEINLEALNMIADDPNFAKKKVIVLAKEGWHNGVIGIVASRITEKFYKPTILISLTNGKGKGSGRSIAGFNLFDALNDSDELLTNFGGHAVAAGLGINEDNIEEFTKKINKYAEKVMTSEDMLPVVEIDCMLGGRNLNTGTVKVLSALEPYGMGNEKPVFGIKNAFVTAVSAVGVDNKHIRMQIEKDGVRINCIGFNMGEYTRLISPGDNVHLAFRLDTNVYQGIESAQLVLVDIKTLN